MIIQDAVSEYKRLQHIKHEDSRADTTEGLLEEVMNCVESMSRDVPDQ